ncbi:MAG: hypothetical protein MAG581_02346 [Deltaproteobacteria bacterium]|jgi:ABC-type uncharacterized transport system permease subunit|nr:hypothetical protein [Deltaproteobacteria bacterium]
MLIAGTWTALLLYIISGISGIYFSTREKPSESLLLKWLAVAAMRTAWCIHTVTLLGLLWSKAVWPETFVSDILNVLAWCSMVVVQALPERLLSLVNPFIIRLFAILLLGLSLIISQRQVMPDVMVIEQTWLFQVLLGTHIIILLAGYVMLGVACVASIIFLYQEHHLKTKLLTSIMIRFPALGTLDRISWQGSLWGFLALSIGILLGIIINKGDTTLLADIRFISSISAWSIFGILLLLRQMKALKSLWIAIWPIAGFVLALVSLVTELLRIKQ